jgi:hypothetical protein
VQIPIFTHITVIPVKPDAMIQRIPCRHYRI